MLSLTDASRVGGLVVLGYRKTGDKYVLYREVGQSFDQQRNPTQIVNSTAHPIQEPDMVRTIRVSLVEQVFLATLMNLVCQSPLTRNRN